MDKPLRIGIDARMAAKSGIGTYVTHLLAEIEKLRPSGFEFVPFADSPYNGPFSAQARLFRSPIYSFGEQWNYLANTAQVDLWHAPHFNVPVFSRSRWVVTIHDLIPILYAGKFFSRLQKIYAETMIRTAAGSARRIIAVSNNTKFDLMRHFGIAEGKIRVIHEGVSGDFQPSNDEAALARVRKKYALPQEPYILYVGLLKPHKNLKVLINAVRKLRKAGKLEATLVIVGKKDARYVPEARYLAEIRSDDDISYCPPVERGDLPLIYAAAGVFVLPSLYEGFGLPVLEAMASGVPVIASNRGSVAEVAGDAALLFDPESEAELESALLRWQSSAELRSDLARKGLARTMLFSWKEMAAKTLKVYEEALA